MAIDLTTPSWLIEKCNHWRSRLGLWDWEIALGLALAPNGDPDCMGLTEQFPDTNFARITLRADVEDNREWEITLVHELLHVKHSRIDYFLERVVFPDTDSVMVNLTYRQMLEPYTHSMATCLVEMIS